MEYEEVKHPKHYNMHPAGIECIEVIQYMTLNIGNAIKYQWRAGLKPGVDNITDLRKAIQYLEFEIKRLENDNKRITERNEETVENSEEQNDNADSAVCSLSRS